MTKFEYTSLHGICVGLFFCLASRHTLRSWRSIKNLFLLKQKSQRKTWFEFEMHWWAFFCLLASRFRGGCKHSYQCINKRNIFVSRWNEWHGIYSPDKCQVLFSLLYSSWGDLTWIWSWRFKAKRFIELGHVGKKHSCREVRNKALVRLLFLVIQSY